MADTHTLPTFLHCLLLLTSHSCKCWMRQFVPSHVPAILMKPVIKYWDNRMKASCCLFFFSTDMFVVSVSVLSTENSYKLVDSCLACLPRYKKKNMCMYTYDEHNTIFFIHLYIVHAHYKIILQNTFTQILPLSIISRIYRTQQNVLCFPTARWR